MTMDSPHPVLLDWDENTTEELLPARKGGMHDRKQASWIGAFTSVTFPSVVSETSGTLSLLGFRNSHFLVVESGDGQRE